MDKDTHYLEKVTWEELRETVKPLNPELSKIIDALDPGKKYKFIKATYQSDNNFEKLVLA